LIDRGRKEATQAAVDAALIKAAEVADCRCDTLLCGCADAILALSLDDSHLRGLMMRVAMKVAYSSAGVAVYKRIVDEELGKTK
jgi:hypothetical protein